MIEREKGECGWVPESKRVRGWDCFLLLGKEESC